MFDGDSGAFLGDVIAELNVALRKCRNHIVERRDNGEPLDTLRQAIEKIELAVDRLSSGGRHDACWIATRENYLGSTTSLPLETAAV